MMLLHSALERQDEIGALATQLAPCEIRHRLDRRLALDQRPEHRSAGHAEDVAHYARQLDVGKRCLDHALLATLREGYVEPGGEAPTYVDYRPQAYAGGRVRKSAAG